MASTNHDMNMWFVLAADSRERLAEVADEIERGTGLRVYRMPKLEEFYVGLRFNGLIGDDVKGFGIGISVRN